MDSRKHKPRKAVPVDPLLITATPNVCWLKPEVPYPRTPQEISREARLCEVAGASILHTHAEGQWERVIHETRRHSSLVIQCGMSSLPLEDRMPVFHGGADMVSIILNHHDEAFAETDIHVLHPRQELVEYMRLCTEYGVKPELEIWHAGSIWNMNYLIERDLLAPPYFATLFFGWPGGTWSPPTVEEYLYRRKLMPEGSVVSVSTMGPNQTSILAAAILHGDHVRVGTEDYPYLGDKVASTHKLVKQVAGLAQRLGRPIATAIEARQMLDIGG